MAEKIDGTGNAVINNIKFTQQIVHPNSPSEGSEILYIVSGSANGGLFLKDSDGRQIGPFVTGTPNASPDVVMIENITLGSATGSFNFMSIPQTYKHLLIIGSLRSDRASNSADGGVARLNADAGTNYDYFRSQINQTSGLASSEGLGTASPQFSFHIPAATATASHFCSVRLEIKNYTSTVLQKIIDCQSYATIGTSSGNVYWGNGTIRWRPASPAAVTQISILPANGPNFIAGSSLTLYGMK